MMVIGVSDSTNHTFTNEVSSVHKYAVTLRFEEPERIGRVDRMALEQPGVTAVEMWNVNQAAIRPASQAQATSDDDGAMLFGVLVPTTMYAPQLRAGRWFQPGDIQAVVLSEALAEEIEVSLDDWVTFDRGLGRESTWQVVGLVFDPLTAESAHVPLDSLAEEIGGVNKANTIWVGIEPADPETAHAVARGLLHFCSFRSLSLDRWPLVPAAQVQAGRAGSRSRGQTRPVPGWYVSAPDASLQRPYLNSIGPSSRELGVALTRT